MHYRGNQLEAKIGALQVAPFFSGLSI